MTNFSENLMWAIIGAVVGIVLEKILPHIIQRFNVFRSNRKIKNFERRHNFGNVEILTCGHPYFSSENMDVVFSESDYYLTPSKNAINKMPPSVGNFATSDSAALITLLSDYGISLEDINSSRDEVTQKFLKKQNGLKFNGQKFGIAYFDGDSRTCDIKENPVLTLRIFKTDYFTHQVVTSTMMRKNIVLLPGTLNSKTQLSNTFCTAMGISLIVILPKTNQIILTLRGQNTAYSDGTSWIYVSVTEAFTETDIGPDGAPSFEACLRRGILEELGISDNKLYLDSMKFYDVFFEKHFLQMGLVASIELTEDVDLSYVIAQQAKDKELEIGEIFTVNNTSHDINNFIEQHRHEMRAQTIFALSSYVSRL